MAKTQAKAAAAAGEERRSEILAFLRSWQHDYPPTVREIAEGAGLVAPSAAHRQLQRLLAEGKVRRVMVSSKREAYTLA